MLRINIDAVSDAELKAALTVRCSEFGLVRKVTILRPTESQRHPYALIEMSDEIQARGLIKEIGGTASGVAAIIRLAPPPPSRKQSPAEKRAG